MPEIKYLHPHEFVDGGFLHEINRLVLHPVGLAMEFTANPHSVSAFVRVWDYREDPEGIYFTDETLSLEKAQMVLKAMLSHRAERIKRLGYVIQPFPEHQVLTTNYTDPSLRDAPTE